MTKEEVDKCAEEYFTAQHAERKRLNLKRAREISHLLAAAIWRVDSAESLLRKAQPETGYRSTEGLGDKPWSVAYHERQVTAAHAALKETLRHLGNGRYRDAQDTQIGQGEIVSHT